MQPDRSIHRLQSEGRDRHQAGVDQCTGKYLPDSMRIIVRNEKPSLLEEMQLSSYGISHVLLVNSYEAFYVDLVKKYKELQASVATSLYSYYNPATVEYSDKAISLSLLSHGNIFDLTSNTFKRGGLHVLRDAVQEVLSNLDEYTCVIVKGRRFSGKTSLLCDIPGRFLSATASIFLPTCFPMKT